MIVFKPMRGLTIAVLICLGILLWLGTWQFQRLQWKTVLLKDIDKASTALPIISLAAIDQHIEKETPVDFRRVSLSGEYLKPLINDGQPFHFLRPENGGLTWRLYQPYIQDEKIIYVATTRFLDKDKPPAAAYEKGTAIGYIRMVQKKRKFSLKSTPSTNRWTVFNGEPEILNWSGKAVGQDIETRYFIDRVDGANDANALPIKKPEIVNNHLDYMLTWYSFALILLIIYFILHKKQGRLYRKKIEKNT